MLEENSVENDFAETPDDAHEMTNVWMPVALRNELAKLKIFPENQRHRESWYSVIQRLVDEHNEKLLKKKK